MKTIAMFVVIAAFIVGLAGAAEAGSFASLVVSYDKGSTPQFEWESGLDYDNPAAALGMPDGVTGEGSAYGTSLLTPFSPAFELGEIVSIGEGGHLTLQLDSYVNVGPGLDLGVVTNVSLMDMAWPSGQAGNPAVTFGDDPAVVEVSADGQQWQSLGELFFGMPANYYLNATEYNTAPPADPQVADFCQPFDPVGGLSVFDGQNFAGCVAAFGGSGGGTWLDLSSSGLSQVGYVRFSVADDGNPDTGNNFEVDAVCIANGKAGGPVSAPVPEPSATVLLAVAGGLGLLRRRGR